MSRVIVGNGAEADNETEEKYPAEFVSAASLLLAEPDRSIAAAADVELAMAVACGGRR